MDNMNEEVDDNMNALDDIERLVYDDVNDTHMYP